MPRLKRVDCSGPGIARVRRGRGFSYRLADGTPVTDGETLARIRSLAIPPAWRDVWICTDPNGHLQAVGTDAAGRKQYLYHERWRARRDREKFAQMLAFARSLPKVRDACSELLAQEGMSRERVLAAAVRLLDRGFFRIGTEGYAEQNKTYGIATIRKSHVRLHPGFEIEFHYVGKGGKEVYRSIVDPEVYDVAACLKRRRGGSSELLAYRDGTRWVDVRSTDINAFIKDLFGGDFSAKDYRTWNATVLAAVGIAVAGKTARSKTARKRAIAMVVKDVAHYLNNTPTIARTSYIDPTVFDRFNSGWTILGALESLGEETALGAPSTQGAIEEAVLDLLADNRSAPTIEHVSALDELALPA